VLLLVTIKLILRFVRAAASIHIAVEAIIGPRFVLNMSGKLTFRSRELTREVKERMSYL